MELHTLSMPFSGRKSLPELRRYNIFLYLRQLSIFMKQNRMAIITTVTASKQSTSNPTLSMVDCTLVVTQVLQCMINRETSEMAQCALLSSAFGLRHQKVISIFLVFLLRLKVTTQMNDRALTELSAGRVSMLDDVLLLNGEQVPTACETVLQLSFLVSTPLSVLMVRINCVSAQRRSRLNLRLNCYMVQEKVCLQLTASLLEKSPTIQNLQLLEQILTRSVYSSGASSSPLVKEVSYDVAMVTFVKQEQQKQLLQREVRQQVWSLQTYSEAHDQHALLSVERQVSQVRLHRFIFHPGALSQICLKELPSVITVMLQLTKTSNRQIAIMAFIIQNQFIN